MFQPETAGHLDVLFQTLLHNPHPTLSAGERELIAAYVSRPKACKYCCKVHGAIAQPHFSSNTEIMKQVLSNPETAPISNKLKALLKIASKVQNEGRDMTPEDVEFARREGATDTEINDTILIAAAFCMYNCYVYGLTRWEADNEQLFDNTNGEVALDSYSATVFEFNAAEELIDG